MDDEAMRYFWERLMVRVKQGEITIEQAREAWAMATEGTPATDFDAPVFNVMGQKEGWPMTWKVSMKIKGFGPSTKIETCLGTPDHPAPTADPREQRPYDGHRFAALLRGHMEAAFPGK